MSDQEHFEHFPLGDHDALCRGMRAKLVEQPLGFFSIGRGRISPRTVYQFLSPISWSRRTAASSSGRSPATVALTMAWDASK